MKAAALLFMHQPPRKNPAVRVTPLTTLTPPTSLSPLLHRIGVALLRSSLSVFRTRVKRDRLLPRIRLVVEARGHHHVISSRQHAGQSPTLTVGIGAGGGGGLCLNARRKFWRSRVCGSRTPGLRRCMETRLLESIRHQRRASQRSSGAAGCRDARRGRWACRVARRVLRRWRAPRCRAALEAWQCLYR